MPGPLSSPPPHAFSRTFQAFQVDNYRLLWPANVITNVARSAQLTMLTWLVLDLTGSPFLVGLVGFSATIPMFAFGLFGGALADTLNKKALLVGAQVASLATSLIMLGLLVSGEVRFWHAYVSVFALGAGFTVEMPARRSLIHDFLGRGRVTNGFAVDSMGQAVSRMIGPAIAGALIAFVGVRGGYYFVSGLYVASGALLSRMRGITRAPRDRVTLRGLAAEMAGGLKTTRRNGTLLAVVAITALMNLLLFPYQHMVPVMTRDVLGVGPALMGVLLAADGLGSLLGAFAIAYAASIRYHGRLYAAATALALAALYLFSLSHSYVTSLPFALFIGVGAGIFSAMQGAIVVLVAPEAERGRALGVISLAIGAGPFGALMLGAVANIQGPALALRLNAAVGLTLVALIAGLMPAIRRPIIPGARELSLDDATTQQGGPDVSRR